MTLPEQERERFCQVLHHSRTSLYRLAFSITRNSSDAQEAVVLFYYEDLPTEEIARIVGTSPGAVRVRLSRAREKLRSILKEGDYG